jgi:hypothetical protein
MNLNFNGEESIGEMVRKANRALADRFLASLSNLELAEARLEEARRDFATVCKKMKEWAQ